MYINSPHCTVGTLAAAVAAAVGGAMQAPHAPEPSLVALFSFVLLDANSRKPAQVPQLHPQTQQV